MAVVSVHLARLSPLSLRRQPRTGEVEGLRFADTLALARLSPSILPRPQPGRFGLIAVWEDDSALDQYLSDHPFAEAMKDGYSVRLEPLHEFGSVPEIGPLVDSPEEPPADHPIAVVTYGHTRLRGLPRFVRANTGAVAAIVASDALLAGTAMAMPPRAIATFSLWRDLAGVRAAADGQDGAHSGHRDAVRARTQKPFHHDDVFIRLRPYAPTGLWDGRDPLAGTALLGR